MRNIKKIIVFTLTMLILICMTGCVRLDLGVNINQDGTASISTTISLAEELYLMLSSSDGDLSAGGESLDIKEFEKTTINDKTYYSYSQDKDFESYSDLSQYLKTLELQEGVPLFESVRISKNEDNKYTFTVKTSALENTSDETGDEAEPFDAGIVIVMTVKMPGTIQEGYKGGELQEDGSIKFLMDDFAESKTYSVSSEVAEAFNTKRAIVIWVVGGAVIAFCMVMFFKQRGSKSHQNKEEVVIEDLTENSSDQEE